MIKEFSAIQKNEPDLVGLEREQEDSTTELLTQMLLLKKRLVEQKGEEATNVLMSMMMGVEPENEIIQSGEKMLNFEEAKESAFRNLEKEGFIEYSPEGFLICDVEKIKKEHISVKLLGPLYEDKYLGNKINVKALWLLFRGEKGISKEDYEAGIREPKDIFYFPENKEEALDVDRIKEADFYLNLSEAIRQVEYLKVKYGNIEDLDYREVLIPLLLYHPKYENAYRDEKTGKLMMAPKDGQEVEINVKYFVSKYGRFSDVKNKEGIDKPREFIIRVLPNLFKNGKDLLRPDDFEMRSNSSTIKTQRPEKSIRQRGMVMFNGVSHTVGAKYGLENGDFKAIVISPGLGGVTQEDEDGSVKLLATFKLYGEKDAKKTEKGYLVAGVKETQTEEYNKKNIFRQGTEESGEQYQDRLIDIPSFDGLLEVSRYLSTKADVNLANFSFKEQILLTSVAEKMEYERNDDFLNFIKEYKEEGVKVLSVTEYDSKILEEIMFISKNIDNKIAWSIFKLINEILELRKQIEDELVNLDSEESAVNQEIVDSISYNITRKAGSLLFDLARDIKQKPDISSKEILNDLDSYKKDLVLSASVYREIRNRKDVSFEDLDGVSFEQSKVSDIVAGKKVLDLARQNYTGVINEKKSLPTFNSQSKEIIAGLSKKEEASYKQVMEMLEIYRKNYESNPSLQAKLLAGFLDTLEKSGSKTTLYFYKKNGEIVAFNRFDDLGKGRKYFGSFNVAPEGAGLAIGAAMMETSLDREAETATEIEADCEPYKSISSVYIDKKGFIVREVRPNYGNTGITAFNIVKRKENEIMYYKDYSNEDIISEYENNFSNNKYREGEPYVILKFESNSEDLYQTTEDLVNNKGYVITRYFFTKDKNYVYCAFESIS